MQTIEIHHTVKGRPDIQPIIERYVLVTDELGHGDTTTEGTN